MKMLEINRRLEVKVRLSLRSFDSPQRNGILAVKMSWEFEYFRGLDRKQSQVLT